MFPQLSKRECPTSLPPCMAGLSGALLSLFRWSNHHFHLKFNKVTHSGPFYSHWALMISTRWGSHWTSTSDSCLVVGGIYVHCSHRCKHGWRVWSQWSLSKPSKCEFWFLNRSVSQYQPTIDLLLQFHLLPIGLLFPWSSNHWPCLSVHLLIEGGYPWTIAEIYWSYRTPTRFFFIIRIPICSESAHLINFHRASNGSTAKSLRDSNV